MTEIVIDTNVLLVADRRADQMDDECVSACVNRLARAKADDVVVLDDAWLILGEYGNKLSTRGAPTPGNEFFKWLLQVQADTRHVSQVAITPRNPEQTLFAEFPPDSELESKFDPADRKFVAVACAHPRRPPILQAADSKWLAWEKPLKQHGLRVDFLCRAALAQIKKRKAKTPR